MSPEVHEFLRQRDVPMDDLLEVLATRADTEEGELAKRDVLDLLYSQIIGIIGTNGNIEDIAESADRSGIAINVVYNAFVDSGFYDFDVNLVKYLVNNNIITLKGLLSALWSSGIVLSIAGDIIGNTTYLSLVLNFVIAALTGKVAVVPLITALF